MAAIEQRSFTSDNDGEQEYFANAAASVAQGACAKWLVQPQCLFEQFHSRDRFRTTCQQCRDRVAIQVRCILEGELELCSAGSERAISTPSILRIIQISGSGKIIIEF